MFTGIVQGVAAIESIRDHDAIRSFVLRFEPGFCEGLNIGASVAVDGVCLTVTQLVDPVRAAFDVILQSLNVTTLGGYGEGQRVNVERSAKEGDEIGGHTVSGHVDFTAEVLSVRLIEGNKVLRIGLPEAHAGYFFAKGFVALNGASLTISEIDKTERWFEVWLIPETRRATVFEDKVAGDRLNVEIERNTQVMVDTIRSRVDEVLGPLAGALESLLRERGLSPEALGAARAALPEQGR
ncbi:MAG: riboflavin synthase subunit alpha [Phenylobacterium sp.]